MSQLFILPDQPKKRSRIFHSFEYNRDISNCWSGNCCCHIHRHRIFVWLLQGKNIVWVVVLELAANAKLNRTCGCKLNFICKSSQRDRYSRSEESIRRGSFVHFTFILYSSVLRFSRTFSLTQIFPVFF